jgi:hypothetical protein
VATIQTQVSVGVGAGEAWDAVRDYGRLHERLVPGFATAAEMDGRDRLVTFATGTVLRERLVTIDDQRRRLVWAIVDGPYAHHNGSLQVFDEGPGRSRLVWTSDVLPDETEDVTRANMERATEIIGGTLGSGSRPLSP